jgi:thiol-disulfide isomerase/thioredoxin
MSVSMQTAAAPMPALDLWADADFISRRLRQPGAELLVVVGAEAWCPKCKRLRPAFEQLCQALPAHILWLWLDLEDHAEFLGNFIPPNLPLLLRWRAGQCVQAAVLQDIDPTVIDPAQCVRMQPLVLQGEHLMDATDEFLMPLPALWQHLAGGCDGELRAA